MGSIEQSSIHIKEETSENSAVGLLPESAPERKELNPESRVEESKVSDIV